jgi:endonuclease YncB( thermonuclease family)
VTIKDSAGHEFNIRIIGIRPATREPAWLESASRATKDFCLGRNVTVRLDKRRIDVDGVHLAHVYVGDELLSYHLVKNGMAVVYSTPSDSPSIIRQLTKAESIAKKDRIGFWSNTPKPDLTLSRSPESVESRLTAPHEANRSIDTTRTRPNRDTRAN